MLKRHGIRAYGKMVCTEGDTYPAFVLVDKSRERQVRRFFAKLSRSQYARGELPDRAISTLKADHSPRLARWIVIQRERL